MGRSRPPGMTARVGGPSAARLRAEPHRHETLAAGLGAVASLGVLAAAVADRAEAVVEESSSRRR